MEQVPIGAGYTYLNVCLLKQLRKERCWTQSKLAAICLEQGLYVSLSSIKRAEQGKPVIYRTALGLATAFQVQANDLRVLSGKPTPIIE